MSSANARAPSGGRPGELPATEREALDRLKAAFPGSKLERVSTIERGSFYMSQEHRAQWQRARRIAREQGRGEAEVHELMMKATRLAIEHWLERKAAA